MLRLSEPPKNHRKIKHPTKRGQQKRVDCIPDPFKKPLFSYSWLRNLARKPVEKLAAEIPSFSVRFFCTMPGVYIAGFLKHPTVGRFFFLGGDTQQSRPKIHAINVHRLRGLTTTAPTRWSCPKAAVSSQGVVAYLKATLQAARLFVVECQALPVCFVNHGFGWKKKNTANHRMEGQIFFGGKRVEGHDDFFF